MKKPGYARDYSAVRVSSHMPNGVRSSPSLTQGVTSDLNLSGSYPIGGPFMVRNGPWKLKVKK